MGLDLLSKIGIALIQQVNELANGGNRWAHDLGEGLVLPTSLHSLVCRLDGHDLLDVVAEELQSLLVLALLQVAAGVCLDGGGLLGVVPQVIQSLLVLATLEQATNLGLKL